MCVKTFFPGSIGSFNPNGRGYPLLQKGYEVSVNDDGFIVDARDPRTNKLYASDGSEVGTRNKPFESDDLAEVRKDIRKTYTPSQKSDFPEGSDMWNALNAGRNVTVDERGSIVEVRDPATGKTYDILGNELEPVVTSEYPEKYTKQVKNPLIVTYKQADKGSFAEGGDVWEALNAGFEVTMGSKGQVIDIWDPVSKTTRNLYGFEITKRSDPYPSDNNMQDIKAEARELEARINALRRQLRTEKGAARAATNAALMALLRERGRKLWLYGRLLNRRRRTNENAARKRFLGR